MALTKVTGGLLGNLPTGTNNVALGAYAGDAITTASYNTAVGTYALSTNILGSRNTALGRDALFAVNSASAADMYNSAVGFGAGSVITTGVRNTMIGGLAGNTTTTGQVNICIGYNAIASAATTNNEIVIGAGGATGKGQSTGFINPGTGGVYQGNNSANWQVVSDRRLKKNIVDSTIGLAEINQLQVRNFEYLTADEITELPTSSVVAKAGVQLGVIAQEIQAILPNCVKEESTGVLSVDPDNLTWHMIKAIQELSTQLDAALARITTLEG